MPDDDIILPGTGEVVATDYVGSKQYQYVKMAYGADGFATLVSSANPVPVQEYGTAGIWAVFEDTSFVTGDSPATLDINAALGRNAVYVSIINDGAADGSDPFTVTMSSDGSATSAARTIKSGETLTLTGLSVDTLTIIWSTDSAYRVLAY
jgi:hypothetical protein